MIDPGHLVEFKFRSKLYSSYSETVSGAEYDLSCRIEVLYEEDAQLNVQEMVIVNPEFAVTPDVAIENAKELGMHSGHWDPTCAAAIFFVDEEYPTDWLLKYEVYFMEDGIEIPKNGDLERFLQMQIDNSDKFPSLLH